MENLKDDLSLTSSYECPLAQSDILKNAETQRKQIKKLFGTRNESMQNSSACELLDQKLEEYNKIVYKDENNIYNALLKNNFSHVNLDRKFKVPQNLQKLDLNSYLKDLYCGGKVYCTQSEQISQAELRQFGELLCKRKDQSANNLPTSKPKISLESRFENLDKLQNPIQNNMYKVDTHKNFQIPEKCARNKVPVNSFVTAKEELHNQAQKVGMASGWSGNGEDVQSKKKLGTRGTARSNKFVSPLLTSNESFSTEEVDLIDPRLKNIDEKMVELIRGEIMDQGPTIEWNDIAGLQFAKSAIQEAVVWPMLRPDIFKGLRRPPKGILLFGPPGTGKTLIGKCVASQSKSTFFSISASSLTSKWIGDGEKMVRALFAVARVHQPSVIFIDEVDSLLTQRSDTEHESSRRIKTEFLVQLDGATTDSEERLLVIGATNRPQELDEAARRRFVRRLYIPLPEYEARLELVKKLMSNERHFLSEEHFKEIAHLSDGYSGADIKNLCSEASLGPIRSINFSDIENIQASEVRPLTMDDFQSSFKRVRPSVSQNDLIHYLKWDGTYGSGSGI